MKPYIQLTLRTKAPTESWAVGEQFIGTLEEHAGLLLPEQISHNPDKFTESYAGKMAMEERWAAPCTLRFDGGMFEVAEEFAWRRRKAIKSTGYVSHTKRNIRGQIVPGGVSFTSAYSQNVDFHMLFKQWCHIFPPQIAMLHPFVPLELASLGRYDSFRLGSFNASLRPDIPEAAWAMFYGPDFCPRIDVERLLAAGFFVEQMGEGILVRVTERIEDVENNFPMFLRRRAELKCLFPVGFFLDKE